MLQPGNLSEKAEDAIFSILEQHFLRFKNIEPVITAINKRLKGKQTDLEPLRKRIKELDREAFKLIDLYKSDIISKDMLQEQLSPIRRQKSALSGELKQIEAAIGGEEVSKQTIKEMPDHFRAEIHHADPKIKKRAVQPLFDELVIEPKDETGARKIKVRGAVKKIRS